MYTQAIIFEDNYKLKIVDQTRLPEQLKYIYLSTLDDAVIAIKQLKVRGAPAIGIVAAYILYVIANSIKKLPLPEFSQKLNQASDVLINCRPTAVNLSWAVNRIKKTISDKKNTPPEQICETIKKEAINIHNEDKQTCYQIGKNGNTIIADKCNLLTHCNAGSLATGGWGTALGVVYAANEQGKDIHVYVDETRPLGQGARLTFWELNQANIPCTLITDSMAASLMAKNKIDVVIFGADRIAANGDAANKIGSYSLAVLANYHKVPCYSAAPLSTFDFEIPNGESIPIELRDPAEILKFYNYEKADQNNFNVYNPAFDVTPAELLTGIITEKGIFKTPLQKKLLREY